MRLLRMFTPVVSRASMVFLFYESYFFFFFGKRGSARLGQNGGKAKRRCLRLALFRSTRSSKLAWRLLVILQPLAAMTGSRAA